MQPDAEGEKGLFWSTPTPNEHSHEDERLRYKRCSTQARSAVAVTTLQEQNKLTPATIVFIHSHVASLITKQPIGADKKRRLTTSF